MGGTYGGGCFSYVSSSDYVAITSVVYSATDGTYMDAPGWLRTAGARRGLLSSLLSSYSSSSPSTLLLLLLLDFAAFPLSKRAGALEPSSLA